MKSSILFILTLIMGGLLITQTSGCTIIGLIAGASGNKKAETVPGWRFEQVQIGSRVELTLADGSVHKGYFKGKLLEPLDRYAIRYAAWYHDQENTTGIPVTGDIITLSLTSGEERTNTFMGLDSTTLYLSRGKHGYESISIQDIESILTQENEECTGKKLLSLLEHPDTPVRTVLALAPRPQNTIPNTYINPDDLELIQLAGNDNLAVGLLVGLAMDVLVAAVIAKEFEE